MPVITKQTLKNPEIDVQNPKKKHTSKIENPKPEIEIQNPKQGTQNGIGS